MLTGAGIHRRQVWIQCLLGAYRCRHNTWMSRSVGSHVHQSVGADGKCHPCLAQGGESYCPTVFLDSPYNSRLTRELGNTIGLATLLREINDCLLRRIFCVFFSGIGRPGLYAYLCIWYGGGKPKPEFARCRGWDAQEAIDRLRVTVRGYGRRSNTKPFDCDAGTTTVLSPPTWLLRAWLYHMPQLSNSQSIATHRGSMVH